MSQKVEIVNPDAQRPHLTGARILSTKEAKNQKDLVRKCCGIEIKDMAAQICPFCKKPLA